MNDLVHGCKQKLDVDMNVRSELETVITAPHVT